MSTRADALARPRLPGGLYALCDDQVQPSMEPSAQAALLLEGGVAVLQVRLKRTLDRAALSEVRRIAVRCRAQGALCLVNDRVDWALLAGADGVHLGAEDLPPEEARRLLGPSLLIGVTVRDLEGALAAERAGADYVGLGPLFETRTKAVGRAPLGLAALAAVARASPLPVVGIAGVTLENIGEVARAGAHGAAVVSDLLLARDLPGRARALQAAFARGVELRTSGASSVASEA